MIANLLAGLMIQGAPAVLPPSECVYHAVPADRRLEIGQLLVARKTKELSAATLAATDQCAKQYRWSSEQALSANSYAALRMGAEAIAYELGHNGWADHGLAAVNALTGEQRAMLAGTGTDKDNKVFAAVLAHMESAGTGVAAVLRRTEDPEKLQRFVLMVKFLALARMQQDRVTPS
jgi:hypothetical protein